MGYDSYEANEKIGYSNLDIFVLIFCFRKKPDSWIPLSGGLRSEKWNLRGETK